MSRGWIGVDLDGTLAHYDGWQGREHIGPPIQKMRDRVLRWIREGREVRIFTARVSAGPDSQDAEIARGYVEAWLAEHGMAGLQVTNVKDWAMDELWDDRVVRVELNTGVALCASPRGLDNAVRLPRFPKCPQCGKPKRLTSPKGSARAYFHCANDACPKGFTLTSELPR